jgi:transposase
MRRGQQKCVSTPGQQVRHHVIGAYDWLDNTVTWIAAERKNSATFIQFLEHLLLEMYPNDVVVLVLDNASFHRSGAALAALSLFEHRVGVFWLPPYCSTLNPIERYWRHLKDRVCVNKLFPQMAQLVAAVERELSVQNDQTNPDRFRFSSDIL